MTDFTVYHIVANADSEPEVEQFLKGFSGRSSELFCDGSESFDGYKADAKLIEEMRKPGPVKMSITRNLINRDAELDCMDCLNQIMWEFDEMLDDAERNRIATWFKARYEEES